MRTCRLSAGRRLRLAVGLGLLPMVLAACDDEQQPLGPPDDAATNRGVAQDRPDEAPFARIAQAAPSFGGYFFETYS